MSLSSISVQRPVLAIVMSVVIVIFGFIGYTFLGVREYPSVDPPIISVTTTYPGASADIIESQITEPLEESINGIAGIRTLTSVSRDGRSTITVEFNLGVDMEAAANDVRDRVSRAIRRLPADADPPSVSKRDADSSPLIMLIVNSSKRTLLELSDIADNVFKERLQTIPGVAQINIWGDQKYAMRLRMNKDRLAAFRLTPLDVVNAIRAENIELPTGYVEGKATELTVRTMGRLSSPEDYEQLIIKESGNSIVRFSDIGIAELGAENERTIMKKNGDPMVGVAIYPQPGSNNIDIAEAFYERLESIKVDLPEDIELEIGFDNTRYIKQSIAEVEETIISAFVLVVLVIFLFLRDWRSTLIPVVTIPISVIGAFFIMYVADFSINVLTLLAVVLSIGIVVDDAIVVLENIYAKIEAGLGPVKASLEGAQEIFFAVISTTIALASVFMPIIFLEGLTGRLFREFGIVMAGAVVISAFVALTLTPMMSSKVLKKRDTQSWFYTKTEPIFNWLNRVYSRSLEAFMRSRWLAFPIIAISLAVLIAVGMNIPAELAPIEDRGQFSASATGPEGATFEYMGAYIDSVVEMTKRTVPEAVAIISTTSPEFGSSSSVNSGSVRITLVDADQRTRSQSEIAAEYRKELNKNTMARAYVVEPQSIGSRRGGLPIQYVIQANNLEKLKEALPRFVQRASEDPVFDFVDLDLKFNKPEIRIEIDREKARKMGVSVKDIAETLQLGLSGSRFGYFIMNGQQYQILGQLIREDRDDPYDILSLYVRNSAGELIQLDNLVKMTEQSTPPQLYRFNRYASATVSASLARGYTIGDGVEAMDRIKEEVLDETYSTALDGVTREFKESSGSLYFAFIFAVVLIYLVLAAQFESFRDPFIILFTVPLALAGALFSLLIFDETMNIFSQIGMIMLVGLVTKNGILIVEFANQRKAKGMNVMESIVGAAAARFRPILMTSLSTVLGIAPIALALGAGSESRVSMGIAVIGGLLFSTILTLYVIPAMYTYMTSKEKRLARY